MRCVGKRIEEVCDINGSRECLSMDFRKMITSGNGIANGLQKDLKMLDATITNSRKRFSSFYAETYKLGLFKCDSKVLLQSPRVDSR